MAIAFVIASSAYNYATSYSASLNVGSGSDRGLVVDVHFTGTTMPTAVEYGGVALTLRNSYKHPSVNEYVRTYTLPNPASGSNTLYVNFGVMTEFYVGAKSYTGVDQTTVIETGTISNTYTASTPITTSVTPTASDCWIGASCGMQRAATASTGLTARAGNGTACAVADSNGTVSSGSPYSVSYTIASPVRQEIVAYAIMPASGGGGSPTPLLSLMGVGS